MRAILFDMDGTLVDSEPAHQYHINNYAEQNFGIPKKDMDWKLLRGKPPEFIFHWMEKHGTAQHAGLSAKQYEATVVQAYLDHIRDVKVRDGVPEVLAAAARNRIAIAVVSSSQREVVQANIGIVPGLRQQLMQWGNNVVTGCDVLEKKPNPMPYDMAARRFESGHRIHRQNMLAVEDSGSGVESAHKAKIPVLHLVDAPELPVHESSIVVRAMQHDMRAVIPTFIDRAARARVEWHPAAP